MIAKYKRQASLRTASVSTPTVTKSFSGQFSRQQSTQTVEKSDDEEVWHSVYLISESFHLLNQFIEITVCVCLCVCACAHPKTIKI